ncbi:MAG TPA: dihydrofolate reductase family protein [Candidatus Eremiobacteraceae bacterium]
MLLAWPGRRDFAAADAQDSHDTHLEIKHQHTGNLLSYGCGEFAYFLATNGLLDEIHFWIHPIIWGRGVKPFESRGPLSLRILSATTFRSGVALLCYEPALHRS